MGDFTPLLKKALKANGCYFVRQGKGDHEIWFSPISQRSFVVDGKIKSKHTANAALQQADIERNFKHTTEFNRIARRGDKWESLPRFRLTPPNDCVNGAMNISNIPLAEAETAAAVNDGNANRSSTTRPLIVAALRRLHDPDYNIKKSAFTWKVT